MVYVRIVNELKFRLVVFVVAEHSLAISTQEQLRRRLFRQKDEPVGRRELAGLALFKFNTSFEDIIGISLHR